MHDESLVINDCIIYDTTYGFSKKYKASNKLIGDAISLGTVYVFDGSHNGILETIFPGE